VLVPSPLRSDLREFLHQNEIGVIEDTGNGFSEYLS
jgi:hypothetical protein